MNFSYCILFPYEFVHIIPYMFWMLALCIALRLRAFVGAFGVNGRARALAGATGLTANLLLGLVYDSGANVIAARAGLVACSDASFGVHAVERQTNPGAAFSHLANALAPVPFGEQRQCHARRWTALLLALRLEFLCDIALRGASLQTRLLVRLLGAHLGALLFHAPLKTRNFEEVSSCQG